jgi:cell wall-associated NlpC family hydrolase
VVKRKKLSLRWLYIIVFVLACIIFASQGHAKQHSSFGELKSTADATKVSVNSDLTKIAIPVKPGDTISSILISVGLSESDSIVSLKKADKKVLRSIRPGGEVLIRLNTKKDAIVKIRYKSPSSKNYILYSGKGIVFNRKASQDLINKPSSGEFIEITQAKYDAIPGVNPEMKYKCEEGLSVFSLPQAEKARLIKSVKAQSDIILEKEKKRVSQIKTAKKSKNEKSRINLAKNTRKKSDNKVASRGKKPLTNNADQTEIQEENDYSESIIDNEGLVNIREQITNIADKYKGTPYKRGQASETATDCSGLTLQVFRDIGMKLPRTSREQFNVGVAQKKEHLKKGDLVFFSTNSPYKKIKVKSKKNPKRKIVKYIKAPRRITHVGIYVGDGKFIHAPRSGYSVKVESLDSGYYKKNYVGARSVLQ